MTIEQIQAAIDAKADARQIINMIADYIQENPGGGGGITLYIGDAPIASDRTVDLNGKVLHFAQGGNDFLLINSIAGLEEVKLQAYNTTGSGNYGFATGAATPTDAAAQLYAVFNGGSKVANIEAFADATAATLAYTADAHVVTGVPVFADNAAAVTGGLAVGTIYRTGDVLKIVHA